MSNPEYTVAQPQVDFITNLLMLSCVTAQKMEVDNKVSQKYYLEYIP